MLRLSLLDALLALFLRAIVPLFMLLYAWQQSHYQFDEYWPEGWRTGIRIAMQSAVVLLFFIGCRHTADRRLVGYVLLLVSCLVVFSISDFVFSGVFHLGAVKAALVAVAMLPIVDDPQRLRQFLLANYWLGVISIALSTVPLLHFLGWVDLPYEQVSRVGGGGGRPDLDPLSFGIFGRTESYAHPDTGLPRLQGWASEPLHWSYFIFWTLACWVLTYQRSASLLEHALRLFGLAFILLQVWFLQSSTARIAVVACLATLVVFLLLRHVRRKEIFWLFVVAVMVPGLLIPFALVSVNGVDYLILNEGLLGEGSNWRGKIEFLYLGNSIYTHFAPALDASSVVSVSHNLVLDFYLRFGYLLLLPLLLQFFILLDASVGARSSAPGAAALIVSINIVLVNPGSYFSPSSVMFQLLVFAAALHAFRTKTAISAKIVE